MGLFNFFKSSKSNPKTLQQDYLKLIAQLNNLIIKYEFPSEYIVSLNKIEFIPSGNGYTQIPLSHIQYNQDKHEFYFVFKNQVELKSPYKYGSSTYDSTEIGSIVFLENGDIKKAEFTKTIKGQQAKIRFKNYKSGFDLYDIKHNGKIIYKRNSKS